MSEEAFHTLDHLSPDRKYEYLNGMAYLMSGVASHMIASREILVTP